MDSSTGNDPHSELQDVAENLQHPRLPTAEGKEPYESVDLDEKPAADSSSSPSRSSHDQNLKRLDSKVVKVPNSQDADAVFAHLPEHEAAILKRQLEIPPVKVSYRTLYRYATKWDIVIMVISAFCACAGGAIQPLMTVVFGNLGGTFQSLQLGTTSYSAFSHRMSHLTLYFVYLGIADFVLIYICTVGFIYTGEHVSQKIREQYLAAVLRQNIAYFDKLGAGEITTRITADTNLVQDGLSEKVGLTLTAVATFCSAFIVGYVKFWKLTLICSCTIVAIVTLMGASSSFVIKFSKKSLAAYAEGGTVAEEVISSIRNATAFGTQEKLARQYDSHLIEAEKWGFKLKAMLGLMFGGMMCIVYLNYGLVFWMGSRFIADGQADLTDILIILLAVIIGAFSLGNVAPNAQAFTSALAAAAKIFSTIDRDSPLDPTSPAGEIPSKEIDGALEFRHVKHIYPSRPEVVVMQDVSLVVPAGKTTALVGPSGSGKSTIVGLVERFYDPVGGNVYLDGHDISTLNLRWLRQQIALVSQEPVLFATTIYGNIRHGLIGSKFEDEPEEQQRERIVNAAKMSNAHDFVSGLPEGYETQVGERGFLLSGGQKQRIAIARAIVSDPKILLLDEATSALDTKSEGVVQAALDAAAKGRTTIVIAHRLSTIKHADNIVVMAEGRIVEQGTHDDLLERRSAYYSLVEAQKIGDAKDQALEFAEKADLEDVELKRIHTSRSSGRPEVDPEDEKLANRLNRTETTKSLSSMVLAKKNPENTPQYSLWTLIKLVGSYNRKEWYWMGTGFVFSVLAGGGQPTQGVIFAKSIVALVLPSSQFAKLRHDANFWSLMYLMLAFVQLFTLSVQGIAFAYCSERLVHRARDQAFRTFLRQDIAFFDEEENKTGSLTSFLSTETTHLAGLSGSTLGTIIMVSTTLSAAMIIALAVGWKLALVTMTTVPVLLGCGYYRFHMLAAFQARSKKAYESSASYACESTSAIRTVASLTREYDVWDLYHDQLVDQGKRSLNSVAKTSTLYAASQSLVFFCIALGFWYGGTLIGKKEYTLFQFFIIFSEVIFGAQSAGSIFSFAPDMGKAKNAATELKKLFDRKPLIDTWSNEGERFEEVRGTIEFRDVHFRYPTRPEQPVLRGLNLIVKPGQYVALVGASGCGKSTTIALLERFYDPLAGGVFIDGKSISDLNLRDYRSHLALVSQEPTLYQGTIKENVLLGVDESDDVSDEVVIKACRDANIYDFIMSLPDGFSTVVGSKGSMLSGGQKQRVAIARALVRDPKILLLDEATSALDSESEKVVQAALDAAAQGRTTIAVAHRLSTIQKADIIYVFDQGRIVESGSHSQLLKNKGRYSELVNLQSLAKMH